jgi:hypothetical protein
MFSRTIKYATPFLGLGAFLLLQANNSSTNAQPSNDSCTANQAQLCAKFVDLTRTANNLGIHDSAPKDLKVGFDNVKVNLTSLLRQTNNFLNPYYHHDFYYPSNTSWDAVRKLGKEIQELLDLVESEPEVANRAIQLSAADLQKNTAALKAQFSAISPLFDNSAAQDQARKVAGMHKATYTVNSILGAAAGPEYIQTSSDLTLEDGLKKIFKEVQDNPMFLFNMRWHYTGFYGGEHEWEFIYPIGVLWDIKSEADLVETYWGLMLKEVQKTHESSMALENFLLQRLKTNPGTKAARLFL